MTEETAGPLPADDGGTRLQNLFLRAFSVMDVAEPLASFDATAPAADVRLHLEARDFGLVGVRVDGLVAGYAEREALAGGRLGDHLRRFAADDVVPSTASLVDTVLSLEANGRCFVSVLGKVGAIVTFDDLDKPPVRMWLFGMITIYEMWMTRKIRETFADGGWATHLSAGRRARAEELLAERSRRGHAGDLVDCLQLADKATILIRAPETFAGRRFASRRAAEDFSQRLQALRNALAHTQREIVSSDWKLVVDLSRSIDDLGALAGGPPGA